MRGLNVESLVIVLFAQILFQFGECHKGVNKQKMKFEHRATLNHNNKPQTQSKWVDHDKLKPLTRE